MLQLMQSVADFAATLVSQHIQLHRNDVYSALGVQESALAAPLYQHSGAAS